jgi:hypothetical protein
VNLPEHIKIGPVRYSIHTTEDPVLVDYRECQGSIDYRRGEIKIQLKGGCQDQYVQTLFHELVHGILYDRGLEELIPEDKQEYFVEQFSRGAMQVYADYTAEKEGET